MQSNNLCVPKEYISKVFELLQAIYPELRSRNESDQYDTDEMIQFLVLALGIQSKQDNYKLERTISSTSPESASECSKLSPHCTHLREVKEKPNGEKLFEDQYSSELALHFHITGEETIPDEVWKQEGEREEVPFSIASIHKEQSTTFSDVLGTIFEADISVGEGELEEDPSIVKYKRRLFLTNTPDHLYFPVSRVKQHNTYNDEGQLTAIRESKDLTRIEGIPQTLDMEAYVDRESASIHEDEETNYRLTAMNLHLSPTPHSGHYVTLILNPHTSQWEYNSDSLRIIFEGDSSEDSFNQIESFIREKHGVTIEESVVGFNYEKVNISPPLLVPLLPELSSGLKKDKEVDLTKIEGISKAQAINERSIINSCLKKKIAVSQTKKIEVLSEKIERTLNEELSKLKSKSQLLNYVNQKLNESESPFTSLNDLRTAIFTNSSKFNTLPIELRSCLEVLILADKHESSYQFNPFHFLEEVELIEHELNPDTFEEVSEENIRLLTQKMYEQIESSSFTPLSRDEVVNKSLIQTFFQNPEIKKIPKEQSSIYHFLHLLGKTRATSFQDFLIEINKVIKEDPNINTQFERSNNQILLESFQQLIYQLKETKGYTFDSVKRRVFEFDFTEEVCTDLSEIQKRQLGSITESLEKTYADGNQHSISEVAHHCKAAPSEVKYLYNCFLQSGAIHETLSPESNLEHLKQKYVGEAPQKLTEQQFMLLTATLKIYEDKTTKISSFSHFHFEECISNALSDIKLDSSPSINLLKQFATVIETKHFLKASAKGGDIPKSMVKALSNRGNLFSFTSILEDLQADEPSFLEDGSVNTRSFDKLKEKILSQTLLIKETSAQQSAKIKVSKRSDEDKETQADALMDFTVNSQHQLKSEIYKTLTQELLNSQIENLHELYHTEGKIEPNKKYTALQKKVIEVLRREGIVKPVPVETLREIASEIAFKNSAFSHYTSLVKSIETGSFEADDENINLMNSFFDIAKSCSDSIANQVNILSKIERKMKERGLKITPESISTIETLVYYTKSKEEINAPIQSKDLLFALKLWTNNFTASEEFVEQLQSTFNLFETAEVSIIDHMLQQNEELGEYLARDTHFPVEDLHHVSSLLMARKQTLIQEHIIETLTEQDAHSKLSKAGTKTSIEFKGGVSFDISSVINPQIALGVAKSWEVETSDLGKIVASTSSQVESSLEIGKISILPGTSASLGFSASKSDKRSLVFPNKKEFYKHMLEDKKSHLISLFLAQNSFSIRNENSRFHTSYKTLEGLKGSVSLATKKLHRKLESQGFLVKDIEQLTSSFVELKAKNISRSIKGTVKDASESESYSGSIERGINKKKLQFSKEIGSLSDLVDRMDETGVHFIDSKVVKPVDTASLQTERNIGFEQLSEIYDTYVQLNIETQLQKEALKNIQSRKKFLHTIHPKKEVEILSSAKALLENYSRNTSFSDIKKEYETKIQEALEQKNETKAKQLQQELSSIEKQEKEIFDKIQGLYEKLVYCSTHVRNNLSMRDLHLLKNLIKGITKQQLKKLNIEEALVKRSLSNKMETMKSMRKPFVGSFEPVSLLNAEKRFQRKLQEKVDSHFLTQLDKISADLPPTLMLEKEKLTPYFIFHFSLKYETSWTTLEEIAPYLAQEELNWLHQNSEELKIQFPEFLNNPTQTEIKQILIENPELLRKIQIFKFSESEQQGRSTFIDSDSAPPNLSNNKPELYKLLEKHFSQYFRVPETSSTTSLLSPRSSMVMKREILERNKKKCFYLQGIVDQYLAHFDEKRNRQSAVMMRALTNDIFNKTDMKLIDFGVNVLKLHMYHKKQVLQQIEGESREAFNRECDLFENRLVAELESRCTGKEIQKSLRSTQIIEGAVKETSTTKALSLSTPFHASLEYNSTVTEIENHVNPDDIGIGKDTEITLKLNLNPGLIPKFDQFLSNHLTNVSQVETLQSELSKHEKLLKSFSFEEFCEAYHSSKPILERLSFLEGVGSLRTYQQEQEYTLLLEQKTFIDESKQKGVNIQDIKQKLLENIQNQIKLNQQSYNRFYTFTSAGANLSLSNESASLNQQALDMKTLVEEFNTQIGASSDTEKLLASQTVTYVLRTCYYLNQSEVPEPVYQKAFTRLSKTFDTKLGGSKKIAALPAEGIGTVSTQLEASASKKTTHVLHEQVGDILSYPLFTLNQQLRSNPREEQNKIFWSELLHKHSPRFENMEEVFKTLAQQLSPSIIQSDSSVVKEKKTKEFIAHKVKEEVDQMSSLSLEREDFLIAKRLDTLLGSTKDIEYKKYKKKQTKRSDRLIQEDLSARIISNLNEISKTQEPAALVSSIEKMYNESSNNPHLRYTLLEHYRQGGFKRIRRVDSFLPVVKSEDTKYNTHCHAKISEAYSRQLDFLFTYLEKHPSQITPEKINTFVEEIGLKFREGLRETGITLSSQVINQHKHKVLKYLHDMKALHLDLSKEAKSSPKELLEMDERTTLDRLRSPYHFYLKREDYHLNPITSELFDLLKNVASRQEFAPHIYSFIEALNDKDRSFMDILQNEFYQIAKDNVDIQGDNLRERWDVAQAILSY